MLTEGKMRKVLGLTVTEDDKQYTIFKEGATEYCPFGGLITDYLRIPFIKLKKIIMEVPYGKEDFIDVRDKVNVVVSTTMKYFEEELTKEFSHIQARIILSDFFNGISILSDREKREDMVKFSAELINDWKKDETFGKLLPEEAWHSVEEIITVRDFYFVLYTEMIKMYVLNSMLLENVMRTYEKYGTYKPEGVDTSANDHIYEFFEGEIAAQDIDYKIMFLENELRPMYTINSSMSLLLFDFAHAWKNDVAFVKCKNCGKFFVPVGRADSKYCSFVVDEETGKTCKDVGAQITRSEKEKSDATIKEYRRIYMKLNMTVKRHPDDVQAAEKLEQLRSEVKAMRSKLDATEITEDEFMKWLKSYE